MEIQPKKQISRIIGGVMSGNIGAATAAFYANRRLLRSEYSALRKWREGRAGAD